MVAKSFVVLFFASCFAVIDSNIHTYIVLHTYIHTYIQLESPAYRHKNLLTNMQLCALGYSLLHQPEGCHPSQSQFEDRRYCTGDRVQRKIKWAFGTRSPFTKESITGLLYTVVMYRQSESLHRYLWAVS